MSTNNILLEVFTTRNANVCSFVLDSRHFGLALEADRHVSRLILQDVATRILHRVSRIRGDDRRDSWLHIQFTILYSVKKNILMYPYNLVRITVSK